jgi:bifunctional non-homologous end joining protein LigD
VTSNPPARHTTVPWPIAPMKAASGTMPHGDVWRFEPKWDGHRAIVRVRGDRVDIVSSSGSARTEQWSWIVAARAAFLDRDAVYDGEVIAYDERGSHSFGLVGRSDRPHALVVFDLLAAGGSELMSRPWEHRRARLEASLVPDAAIQLTPVASDGAVLWDVTRNAGFEGVVAKRVDSLYLPGRRTTSWRKVKHRLVREFVVAGWTPLL